jgi:hypothetical protein
VSRRVSVVPFLIFDVVGTNAIEALLNGMSAKNVREMKSASARVCDFLITIM